MEQELYNYLSGTFNIHPDDEELAEIIRIAKKRNIGFQKPTVAQVQDYCTERKNNVDATRFINHYTSNGWMVGKTKMKDWKAAVRTWEKNNNYERNNNNKQSVSNNSVNSTGSTTGKISARSILTKRYKEQIKSFVPGENKPPTT